MNGKDLLKYGSSWLGLGAGEEDLVLPEGVISNCAPHDSGEGLNLWGDCLVCHIVLVIWTMPLSTSLWGAFLGCAIVGNYYVPRSTHLSTGAVTFIGIAP